MKTSKFCSMELIVLLLCLTCFSSEGHVAKKTRGYRRRDVSQADTIRRALKGGWITPTTEPTFEPTTKSKDEKKDEAKEEEVPEAAEKEDKEEEEETDAPTSSPTVEETTEAPTLSPTDIPMAAAKEDKEAPEEEEEETTDSPTGMPTVEQTTESPILEPTAETTINPTAILVSEANEFTVEPASTSPPSGSDANVPEAPTQEETAVGPTSASEPDPYYVRLEPLYMTVSLSEGDFNEENFMDVLIDYMDYNMVRDLEYFESITYGISTFSQITFIPDSIGRSQNTSTTPDDSAVVEDESPPIVSNTTVHIHLLTSTFSGTPTQPDLVITEYMEMLLENGELFQEYIDTETRLDAQIYSVTLEFEEIVQPTNVQDNTGTESNPNAATAADGEPAEEEEGNRIWQIVGITVGCFVALLWMVTLWGVQSRAVST